MANKKSAAKQARQSEVSRVRNLSRRSAIKTAAKKVINAIETGQPLDKTQELLSDVTAKLARAKSKGVLHKNTASRKLSRLSKKVSDYKRTQSDNTQAK